MDINIFGVILFVAALVDVIVGCELVLLLEATKPLEETGGRDVVDVVGNSEFSDVAGMLTLGEV